jgi:hypothetical protein
MIKVKDLFSLVKILLVCLAFTSCNQPAVRVNEMEKKYWEDYSSDSILLHFLHQAATDSIHSWIDADLDYTQNERYGNWAVDSMFVISKDKNKAIGLILIYNLEEDQSDQIEFVYCEKLNGSWCFFEGETMVIPRDTCLKRANVPLTFRQLSKIGRSQILRRYYGYSMLSPSTFHIKEENFTGSFWGTDESKQLYISRKSRVTERIEGLELYQNEPNPFRKETRIKMKIPLDVEDANLEVYDKNGHCVRSYQIENRGLLVTIKIPASDFSPGIYTYSVSIKNRTQGYKKMEVVK